MKYVSEGAKTFRTKEDGNITIFSIVMMILILAITGAAVDIMRFEAVRAKMQSTMDRAVLAAADLDQQQDPVLVVNDYMAKAGLDGVVSKVTVTEDETSRTVTAMGDGELDTIFLGMSGFDYLTAPALSAAEEKISNVEISLVLDISASMSLNGRIDKLKPSAQAFVEKVMTDESNGVTTLNVVPFSGHVNPGNILFDYFRGERPDLPAEEEPVEPEEVWVAPEYFPTWGSSLHSVVFYFDRNGDGVYDRAHKIRYIPSDIRDVDTFYKGAVAALVAYDSRLSSTQQFLGASIRGTDRKTRYYQVAGDKNGDQSDLGPRKHFGRIPGWTFYYTQSAFDSAEDDYESPNPEDHNNGGGNGGTGAGGSGDSNGAGNTETNVNMPNSCVEIYDDEFATTEMPKSTDFVPHFHMWGYIDEVMNFGWCPDESNAIQYYSADREGLKDFIGKLELHDGTGLQYGMKYGLAMLDPNNRDEVSHLISEGKVDARFEGRPIDWGDAETEKFIVLMTDGQITDQNRPNDPTAAINGETPLYYQSGRPYTLLSSAANNVSNLHTQCDVARDLGVTVFTIAFETTETAASQLAYCASSVGHHFHVVGDEIYDAFDTVARQINNLRLIQ